jgi:SAM-dependent methyltransferase
MWAYRLFLDREPEGPDVVEAKLKTLMSTQEIRNEFVNSLEYKKKNPTSRSLSLSGVEPPMPVLIEEAGLEEFFFHVQNVWQHLGETEPHFSVLTSEQYQTLKIKDSQTVFFNSGQADVERLFMTLDRNGVDARSLKTCLEYGCGLGRVTYWLARRFENVIGYDISKSHLNLASRYLKERELENVSLRHITQPGDIGNFPKVDLVYSIIVLQHNPPPIIRLIIQELVRALNPDGIAYFQVPTYRVGYRFSAKEYLSEQAMKNDIEMHVLPQREIFRILRDERGELLEVLEDGSTGLRDGERSNTFVVRKTDRMA